MVRCMVDNILGSKALEYSTPFHYSNISVTYSTIVYKNIKYIDMPSNLKYKPQLNRQ